MTDQENAAEQSTSHYFCLISNIPREHAWLNIGMPTELSLFNVPAMILIAGIHSVNSPSRISTIKMWSGMPLKLWVQKKKYKKGRNETSSRRPASLQQPPPRKVYTHAQSHRHADTGTITHTQQSGNSRKAGTPTHSRRLKNLAGLNRKSTQRHYSILDDKLGWQGVHTHTSLKPTHQSRSAFSPFLS